MCDCSEERDRRARQRARKEEAEARRLAEEADISNSDFFPNDPSRPRGPRFSLAQIGFGTVGILLALMALILKTADKDTLHAILSKVGLGHLVSRSKNSGCFDPKKKKWPPLPPPPPPPPSDPPCCCRPKCL